ncbi:unnamed protein product [Heterobilharzia americana]|nr:unnamed protein product [Heterobilharzia americana]
MDGVVIEWKKLCEAKNYKGAYDVVSNALNQNMKYSDLYWRKAQTCRDLGIFLLNMMMKSSANSFGKADKMYINGLRLNPECPKCNSWYAVFLNYSSQLEGLNKRIENSFKMKEHWLKANKADPDDYGTLHALGRWCYEVTDLPWVKRKLASTFFGTPPTSTYEEALNYLLESEKKAPGALANNALYIAKTYHRLKRNDLAKEYCRKVLQFTEDDLETEEAKAEASELLKKL